MSIVNKLALLNTVDIAETNYDQQNGDTLSYNNLRIIKYPEHSHGEFSNSINEIKQIHKEPIEQTQHDFVPRAENIEFIDKGKIVVRVMDKHNFYEIDNMPNDYLDVTDTGLLTKLWIYISRATK